MPSLVVQLTSNNEKTPNELIHTYTHTHTYAHTHTHTHIIYTLTHKHIHAHTYIHTIHTHTHTHIHTHTYITLFHCSHNACTAPNNTSFPIQMRPDKYIPHIAHHTSYITNHTSHITHHTSPITHHTSYIIHHTSHITHIQHHTHTYIHIHTHIHTHTPGNDFNNRDNTSLTAALFLFVVLLDVAWLIFCDVYEWVRVCRVCVCVRACV